MKNTQKRAVATIVLVAMCGGIIISGIASVVYLILS